VPTAWGDRNLWMSRTRQRYSVRLLPRARPDWGTTPDSYIYSSHEGFAPVKSVAVAYRRSVFEKIGYFDENFDACEGVELNHRVDLAGLPCFFTPRIAAHYAPRDSLRGLFRHLVRYSRGRVGLLRKHPEKFSWGILPPLLLVAGLVLAAR